jgi:hypothetical protein
MGKFYLILKLDEAKQAWYLATPFMFETYDEARVFLPNPYEEYSDDGSYQIVEVEQYRVMSRFRLKSEKK